VVVKVAADSAWKEEGKRETVPIRVGMPPMAVTIQPFQPDDLVEVLRVLAQALPNDPISSARFTRQVLLDANFRPEGALVARRGSQAVGFCLAIARQVPLENSPPDWDRGYVTLIGVLPGFQRQEIGSRLLEEAERFLRVQERSAVMVSPYAPGYFMPGVDVAAYSGALSFFLARGYAELNRPLAMEAPLWDWQPPDWVAVKAAALAEQGVSLDDYRPALTLPLLEFARAEFPGDWVRVVRETMARILGGEPPSRLIIAHAGGRVLGFVHHENERFGPIGVASSERGRGLGQVLQFAALRAMRENGCRIAWFLWSNDNTARRLYDSAGFREVRRFALLRRDL
jgi:ribosomal protein S18 acetylase RimI-like enzyme